MDFTSQITLAEIIEIVKRSSITPMVEVVSFPSVAFSKRTLITNYYKNLNKQPKKEITVLEKATNQEYEIIEDESGTNFFFKKLTNGTVVIKDLYENKVPYIIMREYGIDSELFKELTNDTKEYIKGNCEDTNYLLKYQKLLGDNTNFFFKKTIYQVR